jgi:nicotinamidase/pyrazinamidase
MTANLLFWDVDTQVDFIHPGGKLYVPGAEKIVPNLRRLTEFARQNRIPVVSSVDAHQPDDPEFQVYPPHCLAGTPGQEKIPETTLTVQKVIPNRPVEVPASLGEYEQLVIEKQALDVFTNPNVDALLHRLGRDAEVVLYGVVTEICISCAARGLLERSRNIAVVKDAVHHLDESKARALLQEVEQRGGRIVTADEVMGLAAARGAMINSPDDYPRAS